LSKLRLTALVVAFLLVLPAAVMAAPQAGDIVFTVGQASYQYDGETIPVNTAPVILNGQAYLPIRDVAQAMGASASWNPTNQSITINFSPRSTISGKVALTGSDPEDSGCDLPITVSIGSGAKLNALLDTGAGLSIFPDS